MGMADAEKKFIVIDVGAMGKQSDVGIIIATELYRRLETKQLNVPPNMMAQPSRHNHQRTACFDWR